MSSVCVFYVWLDRLQQGCRENYVPVRCVDILNVLHIAPGRSCNNSYNPHNMLGL